MRPVANFAVREVAGMGRAMRAECRKEYWRDATIRLVGNFPQGILHIGVVSTAYNPIDAHGLRSSARSEPPRKSGAADSNDDIKWGRQ